MAGAVERMGDGSSCHGRQKNAMLFFGRTKNIGRLMRDGALNHGPTPGGADILPFLAEVAPNTTN